jgi:hypothetical protein
MAEAVSASRAPASIADRLLAFLDAWVPKPAAWAYALRIWTAMMLALAAAFWLQLDSATTTIDTTAPISVPSRR